MMTSEPVPRCARCCRHGLPYSAEDIQRYNTSGWCGWCEDEAEGYGDPDGPQWLCPHGTGYDIWNSLTRR
jgi:hypothetical protein